MSLNEMSLTIDRIYAAALDPKLWGDALRAVENFTGSASAVISFVSKHPDTPGAALTSRFTIEQCQEYVRDYLAICRGAALDVEPSELDRRENGLLIDETGVDCDPVHMFQQKQGTRYYLATRVSDTLHQTADLSLQRTRAQGPAQQDDIERLALLKPHFARALDTAHRMGSLASHECFSHALMSSLPEGVVALDTEGRVLFSNGCAEAMFAAGDALVVTDGKLTARRRSEAAQLARLIANAVAVARHTDHRTGGWVKVERAHGLPYAVFLTPLRCAAVPGAPPAAVLVVIHDPERKLAVSPAVLIELFGLTPAESRLARALAGGHDLTTAADLMGINISTARAHLRAVFAKLGVAKQQDLIRLLATLTTLNGA